MWVRVGELLTEDLFERPRAFYDPPYESPIEDAFAWNLIKHLDPATYLVKQHPAPTICGSFRLDFVAIAGSRRIAFECDGAEFHDRLRDECRDAMILWSGHVDMVYRLKGADLHYRMNEVVGTLADLEPTLFDDRGRRNASSLSRDSIRRYVGSSMVFVHFAPEEDERNSFPLTIERRTLDSIFLQDFAEFAWSRGGGDLDRTIKAFLARNAAAIA